MSSSSIWVSMTAAGVGPQPGDGQALFASARPEGLPGEHSDEWFIGPDVLEESPWRIGMPSARDPPPRPLFRDSVPYGAPCDVSERGGALLRVSDSRRRVGRVQTCHRPCCARGGSSCRRCAGVRLSLQRRSADAALRRWACARSPTRSSHAWRVLLRFPHPSEGPCRPCERSRCHGRPVDESTDSRWTVSCRDPKEMCWPRTAERRLIVKIGAARDFHILAIEDACKMDKTFKRGTRYPQGEHSPIASGSRGMLVPCMRSGIIF